MLDRRAVVGGRAATGRLGEGIEQHVDRLVAVAVDVQQEAGVDHRADPVGELARRNQPETVVLAVEVGLGDPGGEALDAPVEHELHPTEPELVGRLGSAAQDQRGHIVEGGGPALARIVEHRHARREFVAVHDLLPHRRDRVAGDRAAAQIGDRGDPRVSGQPTEGVETGRRHQRPEHAGEPLAGQ